MTFHVMVRRTFLLSSSRTTLTTPAWSAVPSTVKLLPSSVMGRLPGSLNQSLTSGAGVVSSSEGDGSGVVSSSDGDGSGVVSSSEGDGSGVVSSSSTVRVSMTLSPLA